MKGTMPYLFARVCLSMTVISLLPAADPPPDLVRRVALKEQENEEARAHYMYRQAVHIEELDPRGAKTGEYRENREVIFSPAGERSEQLIGQPWNALKRLLLTPEDFRDIREVQPLLVTKERLWLYEVKFRGEETMDAVDCWVLEIRPRQILDGQRLFEGLLWIEKAGLNIVRTEGRAVPQIYGRKSENLFPRFTTIREHVDGKHTFPVHTQGDDTLPFRTGALRMRMTIRYTDYRRFGADSTIKFEAPKSTP